MVPPSSFKICRFCTSHDSIANEILMYFRSTKKNACEISLSDPIDTDKEGNALALMDIISCDDLGMEQVEQSDNYKLMYQYIRDCLDDREREIIIRRFGLDGREPMTQREIAQGRGISRSYVSRIEKKALHKLETAFGSEK